MNMEQKATKENNFNFNFFGNILHASDILSRTTNSYLQKIKRAYEQLGVIGLRVNRQYGCNYVFY